MRIYVKLEAFSVEVDTASLNIDHEISLEDLPSDKYQQLVQLASEAARALLVDDIENGMTIARVEQLWAAEERE